MKTKDYVIFEVAKLLKEIGFNEYCDRFFCKMYSMREARCNDPTCRFNAVTYKELEEGDILRPSLYQVGQWLRENFNIYIIIKPNADKVLWVNIYYKDKDGNYMNYASENLGKYSGYDYEYVYNVGITEAINLIKHGF